ncbi:MAG: precorrin-3B C(17)-methyltransferase, partial [Thermodesulfobacteriota bacterium]
MDKKAEDRSRDRGRFKGAIHIIGIGPGGNEHLTLKAKKILGDCEIVVGYKTYIDLLSPLLQGKEVFSTGMTQEIDRCKKAVELAAEGRKVAIVSSGDAGLYGMAGLIMEIISDPGLQVPHPRPEIHVVPGVPAFCAAAAILGAPIMHDFASISLSDLLTPWEVIERRIDAAALADFVIVLYNPKSKKRVVHLQEAIDIIMNYRGGTTPVGIVRNASRIDE